MELESAVQASPQARVRSRAQVREVLTLSILPFAIACLMLWPALTGQGVFAPTDIVAYQPLIAARAPSAHVGDAINPLLGDVVDTFIPWKMLAREQIYSGRFPLWNPYNALGTPLHANLQSGVLSPFTLLWFALPALWGLGAVAALKWALAGLGMALFIRRLGLATPAAVLGSVAFQLSGPLTAWLQWPISEGLLWVPWLGWAAMGWVDTLKVGWLSAMAVFVAAEWLAGHVETSFHSTVFFAVIAFAAWGSSRLDGRPRWVALGGLAASALLGLALSAAALLPFLAILPDSYQWWLRSQVHTAGLSLPLTAALLWFTPNGFGWVDAYVGPRNWIEANPYVGAVTLLLAGVAIGLYAPRTRWRWDLKAIPDLISPRLPWLWLLLLGISLSMSYGIPPLSVLRELPGFNSSFNWRLISVAGFCLVVLAAMGLDRLLTATPLTAKRYLTVVAGLLVLMAAAFAFAGLGVWTIDSKQVQAFARAWQGWAGLLFCLGAALILLRLAGKMRSGVFCTLVIALLALDMGKADWGFNPTLPYNSFYPASPLLTFAAGRGPTERTAVVGEHAEANILAPYHVPEFSLYDATIDNRYLEYARLMSPETFRESFRRSDPSLTSHLVLIKPNAALLSAIGIKWVLGASEDDPNSWQAVPANGPIYKKALTKNGFTIWENLYARPFTYLATRFHLIRPEQGKDTATSARERVQSLAPDTVDVVQVEDPSGSFPSGVGASNTGNPLSPSESAALESYAPGDIKVKVKANSSRLLTVSEGWSRDWRAYIDGKLASIYRTNYMIQGVVVPEGEHEIRLSYEPPSFAWGVAISLAAAACWLIITMLAVRRWAIGDRRQR